MTPETPTAKLALDTILQKPTDGIPSWLIHTMEHDHIDRLAGVAPGSYVANPQETYLAMQKAIGTCMIDQWIPENPLKMRSHGYDGAEKGATTGLETIVRDGIVIDSPEAVVEHMETFVFPQLQHDIATFDENARTQAVIDADTEIQDQFGPTILKVPYGYVRFPYMRYFAYGYANYFMAYALYPEIMEHDFSLQADLSVLNNRAAARAYAQAHLPPLCRSDHDMADSRGTLVNIESLDKLWFPHFARAMEPVVKSGVKVIWHCDGNLSQMLPRLLDVGLAGFQGFQYEDGMDYQKICKMKTRDGDDLIIIAGVSVTRTLPHGTANDVRTEMRFLVKNGPETGLFLGGSSSITPGVPWENIKTFVDGLAYYREHGRKGNG